MILYLCAKPNARAYELLVAADGSVTVRLKAPPQDGQANAALLAFLAEVFETGKSRAELLSGHTKPQAGSAAAPPRYQLGVMNPRGPAQ